jgi:hypothetical protein
MPIGPIALMVAAMFSGAAIYVSACEQPARLALDDRGLLAEWQPAYKRGAAMQGSLALVGTVLGLAAWWTTRDWRWLVGAALLLAPWPYTLLVIKPTNDRLLATALADAGPQTRALVERWGRLHRVRTALGLLATLLFLHASVAG